MAARDSIRTAYSGDENKGPARNQKKKNTDRVKARRLPAKSEKTPIR
jgi:hypothetical protein